MPWSRLCSRAPAAAGEREVLLGLRSAREAAGEWALPAGLGSVRRDITAAAAQAAGNLLDLEAVAAHLDGRQRLALLGPAGFALAEAAWYLQIPAEVGLEDLVPLPVLGQLTQDRVLIKTYFSLEWEEQWGEPRPAERSGWPFLQARFFTREEMEEVEVAFGCDADLEAIFWV